MREPAFKILLAASLVFTAPLAQALTTKHAHKPVAVAHAVTKAKPSRATKFVEVRAAHGKAASSRTGHAKPVPSVRVVSREKARPHPVLAERTVPAPIVRMPPAQEQTLDSDAIHVTHDRKQHFAADPNDSAPEPGMADAPDDQASAPIVASAKPTQAKTAPAPAKQASPVIVPVLYNKQGRLIVPPAMKGSHEILVHQNEMADQEGLDRIQDDDALEHMREAKLLVPIPSVAGLQLDERLPANRRYCRPWTEQFLTTLARAYYARFHSSLQVNSAVRTVEVQERLLRTNGNAAPAEGETASPHLTGQAVDLAKHGLSMTQIAWLRGYLMPLVQAGKVDVEEEFQQACFHISVYRKYLPQPAPRREIAEKHSATGATLAAAIR